jgi:hypothetical protein
VFEFNALVAAVGVWSWFALSTVLGGISADTDIHTTIARVIAAVHAYFAKLAGWLGLGE